MVRPCSAAECARSARSAWAVRTTSASMDATSTFKSHGPLKTSMSSMQPSHNEVACETAMVVGESLAPPGVDSKRT